MALCDHGCVRPLPCAYGNACGATPKQGGIDRIYFVRCDYEFTDITDDVEWVQAIKDGDVVVSGLILGSKPKGTFNKKRVTSCGPERVIGVTRQIEFKDFNQSEYGGAGDIMEYTFWNTILANPAAFRFGWIVCDNFLYGPFDNFTIEVDETIEESSEENRFMEGTIFFASGIRMPVPVEVALELDQDSSVVDDCGV